MRLPRSLLSLTAIAVSLTAGSAALAAPIAPSSLVPPSAPVEQVQYRHWHHDWHRPYWHRHYGPGAAVVGGLAAGALIGSAIANSEGRADASAYCAQRYESYDPASGTYLGYDGARHPCP
ncbi:BA14K family protein [Bradyrhizobium sp. STM 3561]|uniref:BA14K family protein n=1 Tax=Bradyrhizobium sp. STM 3561 TaxID=578923 RepID=UPI003890D7AF